MRYFLLILFIGIAISSCQKEEEGEFISNGKYKLSSSMTLSGVRMYTSNGEITEEATIRKFLTGKPDFISNKPMDYTSLFFFNETVSPLNNCYFNITIGSSQATVFTNQMFGANPDQTYEADVFRQGRLIVISKGDLPVNSIEDFFNPDDVPQVKLWSHHTIIGPTDFWTSRQNIALLKRNNQVILPYLIYVHWKYFPLQDKYTCLVESNWNILNTDYLTRIPDMDTVVVQEGWAILQKTI